MMRLLPLVLLACDPHAETCDAAWATGYQTGHDVGAACYGTAPTVTAFCTSGDEAACLECLWDGYDAGFTDGDALCP